MQKNLGVVYGTTWKQYQNSNKCERLSKVAHMYQNNSYSGCNYTCFQKFAAFIVADIKGGVNILFKMRVILTFAKLYCQVCMLRGLYEFEKSSTVLCP